MSADKFMPQLHLKQPEFTYSACRPFIIHRKTIKKFRETGDVKYLHGNKLDKSSFFHDAAYSDSNFWKAP